MVVLLLIITLLTQGTNIENNILIHLKQNLAIKQTLDLSNILKPKQPIANMITSQANELGDDTTSEVKINTIYTDLTVNGRGVFVNGNRIDSSMEWKDITNTWQTRNWSKDDVGKQVRITTGTMLWDILWVLL